MTPCAARYWCWTPTCHPMPCCSLPLPAGPPSSETSRWPCGSPGPRCRRRWFQAAAAVGSRAGLVWSRGRGRHRAGHIECAAHTDTERALAAISRATTLGISLGHLAQAETVLDAIASAISDDAAALELVTMRSVLDAFRGRTVHAAEDAARVLANPRCSPTAPQLAGWGLATACGGLGRLQRADENLSRIEARADPGLHQAVAAVLSWVRGLLLGGGRHPRRQWAVQP